MESTVVMELNEAAKEVNQFNTKLASEINSVASEMTKEAMTGLLQPNMRVVCLNPVQGIFKGRVYIVSEIIEPGIVLISEVDGTKVGAFQGSRFCQDNSEY